MKFIKTDGGLWHNPNAEKHQSGVDFDASFRAKYGGGYIDSEPAMRHVMFPRVRRIERLARPPVRLLDVGTAYGTFLDCLPFSWEALGIEALPEIAEYARGMGRNVISGTAEDFRPAMRFNVITMWNVIEHLENTVEALANLTDALSAGGLLCVSTPNAAGGFFRFRREEYEAADDVTHAWAFTPKTLGRLLERFGFEVEKVVITGHHPERWGGTMWASRLFKLGDTFEIYARKRS